jgi:hypothetical protein
VLQSPLKKHEVSKDKSHFRAVQLSGRLIFYVRGPYETEI